jgi:hypothetical protein
MALGVLLLASLGPASAQEGSAAPQDSVKAMGEAQTASEHVTRAAFSTEISEREPVNQITVVTTEMDKVFFFTEIVGLAGMTVTHRWVYDGETKAEVQFQIGADRWRVYSSKTLIPEWVGTWSVDVLDGEGNKIYTASLDYQRAP